jgi:hypothetical protein
VKRLKVISAVCYAIAMASSVVFFLFPFESGDAPFLAAGLVAVLAAALLGYWLGSWYFPLEGERSGFELIACPLLVLFLATLAGSATVILWGLSDTPSGSLGLALLWVIPASLIGMVTFTSVAWPTILVSFSLAGIALARMSRSMIESASLHRSGDPSES